MTTMFYPEAVLKKPKGTILGKIRYVFTVMDVIVCSASCKHSGIRSLPFCFFFDPSSVQDQHVPFVSVRVTRLTLSLRKRQRSGDAIVSGSWLHSKTVVSLSSFPCVGKPLWVFF